jgi:hypothetical protein
MTMRSAIPSPSFLAAVALVAVASAAWADDGILRKEALRVEIDLAESKQVYAVLDPNAGEVRLELATVVLQRFPAIITVGTPREMGGSTTRWPAMVFTLESGMPEMQRPTIIPPDPGGAAGADSTKPAAPTENLLEQRDRMIASVPAHFTLLFSPTLEMIIAGEDDSHGTWATMRERLNNTLARLRKQELPMRVRLQVSAPDARRFGLALRQGMQMLVMPPMAKDDVDAR